MEGQLVRRDHLPPLLGRAILQHCGYALRHQQPPWSVSAPALAAITACLTPAALAEATIAADTFTARRDELISRLTALGLPPAGDPRAPFLLLDTSPARGHRAPGWVRLGLRDRGFAVRRGDTFPGLGADWIRVAVRDTDTTRAFTAALADLVGTVR